jgi:FkbM family methyltransferase
VVSIYLARKYPFIKVYAVEPDPLNYGCLKRNIELNGVTNVTAINKSVSGDGQKRTLYVNARESAWATIDARMTPSHLALRTVQVETVTLEQLFQEFEIRHCRLMKITAPGAIHESLKGFTRSGCVDLLCGEVDFGECSRVRLEMASWTIARQHFWRTIARQANGTIDSWIHQRVTEFDRHPAKTSSSVILPSGLTIHSPQ